MARGRYLGPPTGRSKQHLGNAAATIATSSKGAPTNTVETPSKWLYPPSQLSATYAKATGICETLRRSKPTGQFKVFFKHDETERSASLPSLNKKLLGEVFSDIKSGGTGVLGPFVGVRVTQDGLQIAKGWPVFSEDEMSDFFAKSGRTGHDNDHIWLQQWDYSGDSRSLHGFRPVSEDELFKELAEMPSRESVGQLIYTKRSVAEPREPADKTSETSEDDSEGWA